MKKLSKLLLLFPMLLGALVGCNSSSGGADTPSEEEGGETKPQTVHVESISFDTDRIDIYVGDTYELKVTVLPENATNKKYNYIYQETSFKIEGDTLTALKVTNELIYVESEDGGKFCQLAVVVTEKPQEGPFEYTFNFENSKEAISLDSNMNEAAVLGQILVGNSVMSGASSKGLYWDHGGLKFGSQGAGGELELQCNYNMYSITFVAETYWTKNDYYNDGDKNSYIKVDDQVMESSLGYDDNGAIRTTVTFDFATPTKTTKITNVVPESNTDGAGRFILFSMTITYK